MVIKNTTKTKQTKRATVPQSHIWTGAILTDIKMLGLSFTPIIKHTTSTLHFVLLRKLFSFLSPLVEILRFVHIAYEKKKKANVAWPSLCSAQYHDWEQINTLRDGFAQSFLLNALVCQRNTIGPLWSLWSILHSGTPSFKMGKFLRDTKNWQESLLLLSLFTWHKNLSNVQPPVYLHLY